VAAHVEIAIIGAGFGGLGAAIRLSQRGYTDIMVFERADALGGTWRDNSYPGCACDVPSHLYSFSFALNPDWSRTFSPQPEIWAYLCDTAAREGVDRLIRYGHDVRAASYDAETGRWLIETSRGPYTADVLVAAAGPLAEPALPKLPGLETFEGTAFHSARWRHDHDLTGRRVAVIGTGASAIQFIPEIQPQTGHLTVFQRTAPWVMGRREREISRTERWIYRHVPGTQKVMRAGIYWAREAFVLGFMHPKLMRRLQKFTLGHLRKQVPDAALRAKLTPTFTMGCKRILQSNVYYPALAKPNVEVVTEPIREVRPHGIVTADGVEHRVDTIIFGTGFHVTDMPIGERLRGRDGRPLAEVWQGSPRAYLGSTVAGFPNLFLLLGPSTGLGHNSVVFMIECQLDYLLKALEYRRRTGSPIEPREAAQAAFADEMDRGLAGTVWAQGGCRSWYQDSTGRLSTLWPGATWRYWLRTRRVRMEDYAS
jgi:cation diffusion facilitator CzcD-associated flavoprotein CzcO